MLSSLFVAPQIRGLHPVFFSHHPLLLLVVVVIVVVVVLITRSRR